MIRKYIAISFCTCLSLFLLSCSDENSKDQNNAQSETLLQLPSPFIDCDTIEQAEKIVGFEANVPHTLPQGYSQSEIQTISEKTVQVFYKNNENTILFRQAKGTEDISGDYNVYKQENIINLGDFLAIFKGNNNKISLATWTDENFSYSLSFNPIGIEQETVEKIISSTK